VGNESDEAELWERARSNDGRAFAELFDLHRDRVYRRALGLVEDSHDAEDVTAATFFELWRRRHSVRVVDGSVLAWLLVTAVNVSRNQRRSTARYQRFLRNAPRSEAIGGPEAEPIETKQRLATSLRRLSPGDGALFVLVALEGVSVDEAAQVIGVKPGTARVRLSRARARLRIELGDLASTPIATEGTRA
jgi:RNA polymerase sigma-70 factor (ECF subfamily)